MSSRSFEDVLLCRPEFMDPSQGGLWWCESAEDIAVWPVNSVCLAGLASWEDVKDCKDWICSYPFVLVASPTAPLWTRCANTSPGCPSYPLTLGHLVVIAHWQSWQNSVALLTWNGG